MALTGEQVVALLNASSGNPSVATADAMAQIQQYYSNAGVGPIGPPRPGDTPSGKVTATDVPLPPPTVVPKTTGLPVSVGTLTNSAGAGDSTLAAGMPIFQAMIDNLLKANADRRATVDQNVSIAKLLADLSRVSPTRAADIATSLGMKPNIDLSFLSRFGTGTQFPAAGGSGASGTGGNPLPSVFGGQELDFLGANPNVMNIVKDVADKYGYPDIMTQSMAARIPALSSIISGGF